MPKYIISEEAKKDLLAIALYGDQTYGTAKSTLYCEELEAHFQQLAQSPKMYMAVEHIRAGYSRSVCGSHSIYYRIKNNDVEIMRIMGKQSIDGAFGD